MSGLSTQHSLIFDPQTGRLLDAEQMLGDDVSRLNVAPRSVIGYTVYSVRVGG